MFVLLIQPGIVNLVPHCFVFGVRLCCNFLLVSFCLGPSVGTFMLNPVHNSLASRAHPCDLIHAWIVYVYTYLHMHPGKCIQEI